MRKKVHECSYITQQYYRLHFLCVQAGIYLWGCSIHFSNTLTHYTRFNIISCPINEVASKRGFLKHYNHTYSQYNILYASKFQTSIDKIDEFHIVKIFPTNISTSVASIFFSIQPHQKLVPNDTHLSTINFLLVSSGGCSRISEDGRTIAIWVVIDDFDSLNTMFTQEQTVTWHN